MNNITLDFDGLKKGDIKLMFGHNKTPLSLVCPKITESQIVDYFQSYTNANLIFATITLGYKKWITKKDRELYELIHKDIKRCFKTSKYVAVTEYTKSNILHFHILASNETNQGAFIEKFRKYGSRNAHKSAFQQVKNKNKTIKYIMKDQENEYVEEDDFFEIRTGNRYKFPITHNIIKD